MKWAAVLAFVVALPTYGCGGDVLSGPDRVERQTWSAGVSLAAARPLTRDATLRVALDDAMDRLIPALTDPESRALLAESLREIAASVEHARFAETRRTLDQARVIIGLSDGTDPDLAAIALVLEQIDQLVHRPGRTPATHTSN